MRLLVASALLAAGYSVSELGQSQVKKKGDSIGAVTTTGKSSSSNKQIKYYFGSTRRYAKSPIGGSSSEPDTGILSRNKRSLQGSICSELLQCTNGVLSSAATALVSCKEACGDECCVGTNGTDACEGFTGAVCKDGVSCMGENACQYATIDLVVGGCNGKLACSEAGYDGGHIGEVHNSCLEDYSCYAAALGGGHIGSIVNSCNGRYACEYAADAGEYYDDGGNITGISLSCIGDYSCYYTAGNGGNIGNVIQNSCIGDSACSYAATYGGRIPDGIIDSCLQGSACNLTASCAEGPSKNCGGTISAIVSSCDGTSACERAAYDGGFIGGIMGACNSEMACRDAAVATSIPSGFDGCCNADSTCFNATALPGECEADAVSNSPTSSPSMSPSKAPTSSPSSSPTVSPIIPRQASKASKQMKARKKTNTLKSLGAKSDKGTLKASTPDVASSSAKSEKNNMVKSEGAKSAKDESIISLLAESSESEFGLETMITRPNRERKHKRKGGDGNLPSSGRSKTTS